MDVIASIQNAMNILGKLRALGKKVEDAEFKMLLADLSSEMADAKLEVANLKDEVASLQRENITLRERLSARSAQKPEFSEGAYVFAGEAGHFCTACFDSNDKKVRLTQLPAPFDDFGRWQCPSCHAILASDD